MVSSSLVILAYASAGLGHLRVTNALRSGLSAMRRDEPQLASPVLLASKDASVTRIHRIMSVHPVLRSIMEWTQRGWFEDVFTVLYSRQLRRNTQAFHEQISSILAQQKTLPKSLIFVATHFGQAHQLASLKPHLERELGIKAKLIVCVTDDSPQHMWYVAGADLIVVPSFKTKAALRQYSRQKNLANVQVQVAPYPISPFLAEPMKAHEARVRKLQATPGSTAKIRISMPVSGAAVGLNYSFKLLTALRSKSKRFVFYIVSRSSMHTNPFLARVRPRKGVHVYASRQDQEVVQLYDKVFGSQVLGFEVTKPSEQAFKALCSCKQRGGAIMLFTEPVGRQEYDNLDFLARHNLIPETQEQINLWSGQIDNKLLAKARFWRGIRLPKNPEEAADFIEWCLENKIFSRMMTCKPKPAKDDPHVGELGTDGVRRFWQMVEGLV